jgi:asparagine synthase (glutamine-hydrolysing)
VSGIAVIWNRDGRPLDTALIVQMTRLMAHRGPDGDGHWNAESIAIGHCALNTTLESIGERQPLHDETGNLSLTFDGRIDNREELLSLLPENGSGPHSHSDAELVIAAYRKWGEECAAHLLGDFAFAIWDRHRRQLFCARDPLGVCPLFYAESGNTFVCASEIRSLFALPGLKKEPQLAVVTARLLGKHVQFDETLYNGIIRLPMAHCLTVTAQGVSRRRYWEIDPNR